METETICSMHKMHCCAACQLKLHVGADGMERITSAGDTMREGALEADSALVPMQRRACMRGYGEIYHMYGPDRIRYPMLQTGRRGDLSGFKRISWEEAIKRYAEYYERMRKEAETLSYLPLLDNGGIGNRLGTVLYPFGASSCGNVDAAITAALGRRDKIAAARPLDMLNANYIILWSCDPAVTLPSLPYMVQKAREKGIPITVVDSRYTESAGAFATGKGKVPGLISPYPGTDGALLAAMAYVIYRRGLFDEAFIRRYCFGFYPGERVVSRSEESDPVTGLPYRGREFAVPRGESFTEYLEGLEREHGGYRGVLSWASASTGVPEQVIEDFAVTYAASGPVYIAARFHGGVQRTYNGFYYSWLLIALCAMTGNLCKKGAGFGEMRGDDGYTVHMPALPDLFEKEAKKPILVSQYGIDRVILTGTDGRSFADLRDDILRMNGIDIGGGLRLKGLIKGAANGNPFNQLANINKRREAWSRLDFVVTYERHMTPTAQWSDLVLPVTFPLENGRRFDRNGAYESDVHVLNGVFEPMYEAVSDEEVNRRIGDALGVRVDTCDYEALMRRQWEKAEVDKEYPDADKLALPDFEEIVKTAHLPVPVKPGDVPAALAGLKPGKFPTETGRINFYSPFLAGRGRTSHGINSARYVPLKDGYEAIKAGREGARGVCGPSGRRYTLQLITPHAVNRANSDYANIPFLAQFNPHCIHMHPDDALTRGIADGETAYAYTEFGCLRLPVQLSRYVKRGVIAIEQGAWYKAGEERYLAYFDSDGDGIPEPHPTPVDIGGCPNTLTEDLNSGVFDPFINGMGLNAGGSACEVSKSLPEGGERR